MSKQVTVFADAPTLSEQVADSFLQVVQDRISAGFDAHVCLTGGTMGIAVLRSAAAASLAAEVDWSRVHFWWGDDRFVPADHADRNSGQARAAFLDHIAVPAANVHVMAASDSGLSLDEAAVAYAADLARYATAGTAWPAFDICFLGMGPDAHIASLFPGRVELAENVLPTLAVRESPKPPPERVTLTLPVINSAARVWVVVAGADKTEALAAVIADADLPAAKVSGTIETRFFADPIAAGK